ncbi:MAG: pyrroloquinoline quinone-dependent dehydrogenase [Bryobacterales bacterium]|nr:pyrroloquinoline quinone-dependent dehydrogenase [Bryobacterales bacterium]
MVNRRDFLASPLLVLPAWSASPAESDWRFYGGDAGASRYSPLDQIKRGNAAKLKPAWSHAAGDALQRPATTIECTPLVADGVMYLTTARVQVRALNAATGEPLWNFNPLQGSRRATGVNRGVTYFEDGKDKRVFAAIQDKLYSLNPKTGELLKTFGDNGIVDLTTQFDRDMGGLNFRVSSPAVVFEDTVIVGGGGGEGPRAEGPGHIRGYDVYTGKRKWIFHTIPHPGEFGYNTWPKDSWQRNGAANNWAGMSIDLKRGWVFVSTGSASFDFWGGDRHGDNLFSDCVIALDARTGKRIWHFQTVHHDVWDYDLPAQPALVTVKQGGRMRDAVAQVTKTAFLFLLDRETGKPLLPIEERKVPPSDIEDEKLSPTQPFPVKPKPFARIEVNEDLVTDISPEARAFAMKRFKELRGGTPFAPPSKQGTIYSPGTLGGALWGGCAFDPATSRVFVNSSELPSITTIRDAAPGESYRFGITGYEKFVDHEGYPGVKPPWGHLTAIDLASGDFVWREPIGEYPALAARGLKKTGTYMLGGCINTAGGVVFMGATADEMFRAIDSASGAVLWEHKLPAGGYATPCTYSVGGKQFVVIACGGGNRQKTTSGDQFVAFSL